MRQPEYGTLFRDARKDEGAERLEAVRAMLREFIRDEDCASQLPSQLLEPGGEIHRRPDAGEVETCAAPDVAVKHLAHVQDETESHAFVAGDIDRASHPARIDSVSPRRI